MLKVIKEDIKFRYNSKKIADLGEIIIGKSNLNVFLGSCISIIFYSPKTQIGGLSHIAGYEKSIFKGKYLTTESVLNKYIEICNDKKISDPFFFLISTMNIYHFEAIELFKKRQIKLITLLEPDNIHKHIEYNPSKQTIRYYNLNPTSFPTNLIHEH